jgi:hypothetical protein
MHTTLLYYIPFEDVQSDHDEEKDGMNYDTEKELHPGGH